MSDIQSDVSAIYAKFDQAFNTKSVTEIDKFYDVNGRIAVTRIETSLIV